MTSIKGNIKNLRRSLNLKHADIARLLGVSISTLSRWIRRPAMGLISHYERLQSILQILNEAQSTIHPNGLAWWFRLPHPFLGDLSPLDLMASPVGITKVRTLISIRRWSLPV